MADETGQVKSAGSPLATPRIDPGSASGSDMPQLIAPPPLDDGLKIDEITDKLIEKREKLEYFIVTASTAVIVFTLKDFNNTAGLLHLAPLWLIMWGWASLLAAAGCSLLALRRRHALYSINQDLRYERRTVPTSKEATRIRWSNRLVSTANLLMGLLFISGMAVLATAYGVGLSKVP